MRKRPLKDSDTSERVLTTITEDNRGGAYCKPKARGQSLGVPRCDARRLEVADTNNEY